MCNRYTVPASADIERHWHVKSNFVFTKHGIGPLGAGPFLHANAEVPGGKQMRFGQWGMLHKDNPDKIPRNPRNNGRLSTNNARTETMAKAYTFRDAWNSGRRCLIPAAAYMEPFYPEGATKSTWWAFERPDHRPWALAGIWSTWVDKLSGELLDNYSMLTMNCDEHPLLALMHKPDPSRPEHKQDKRAVIPVHENDWDLWLNGTEEQARALFKLDGPEGYASGPENPASTTTLPLF